MTVNDVNDENEQLVNDDDIVGGGDEILRRDNKENHEDESVSSRSRPRQLTADHLNKYKKEHQYLSSNTQTNIKDDPPNVNK